jgi:hypothetical protein
MQELLSAVERNAVLTRKRAIKALSLLETAENSSSPMQYRQVMGALADLRPLWTEHIRLLSHAGSLEIAVLRQFEEELKVTSSAGWARTPALGIHALRLRVTTTLRGILCQMEKEQTTVIPLLRRSAVRTLEPVPLVRQMATA